MSSESDWLFSEDSIEREFCKNVDPVFISNFIDDLRLSSRSKALLGINCLRLSKYRNELIEKLFELTELHWYSNGKADRRELEKVNESLAYLVNRSNLGEAYFYYKNCQSACSFASGDINVANSVFASYNDNKENIPIISKIISSFVSPTLEILPEHKTSTVVTLANGIYIERAWDRMPILADALQDTGFESQHLNYLRDTSFPWCRGAKILDLLKSI